MIVSASYRTDIPAFYAAWFRARLAAGSARVRNPYGGRQYTVDLSPGAVDGFVFWTRNAAPFLPALEAVAGRGTPFVVQVTVTGYPSPLEPSVIPMERAVAQIRALAGRFGGASVVWRYDPIFVTDLTPPEAHRRAVADLARDLAGHVDEVVFSFTTIYRKSRANTDRAAARHGFIWRDPEDEEKRALLADLGSIAAEAGIRPSLCAQPALTSDGLALARCIDAERLSRVAGREIHARTKGNRDGCLCAESRDIGAYDTCPHGCTYCYAVRTPAAAKAAFKAHNRSSERL